MTTHINNNKPIPTVRDILATRIGSMKPIVPAPNEDSAVFEENRKLLVKKIQWFSDNPKYLEKSILKVITVLERTKQDEVIFQSVLNKNLIPGNKEKSLAISAQAIYLLSRTKLLNMTRTTSNEGHNYYRVSLGEELQNTLKINVDLRRIKRRIKRKASRKALNEFTSKVSRNNSKGLYDFDWDDTRTTRAAMEKVQENKLRLYIPESIDNSSIVQWIFKKNFDNDNENGMAAEILDDLNTFNGSTFYVDKSADRSLRIYGKRNIDISAPSAFRVFLRLPRKRKLTEAGCKATVEHYRDEVAPDFKAKLEAAVTEPEKAFWQAMVQYVHDITADLQPGDYTDLLVEVDANNQGPANICLLMKDKKNFNKYWGSTNAPKLYKVFKHELMKNLGLKDDLLADKDIKYKIMTKPYNKQDISNVLGGDAFWEKINSAFIPAIELNKYDFFELPLKLQLQKKLGDKYSFSDEKLMKAYVGAMDTVAPFLNQFKNVIDALQQYAAVKPSIWKWRAMNGDVAMAARSTVAHDKVSFYDLTGKIHTITYDNTVLVEQNKFGGETVLSPTLLASVDASMNTYILLNADHWITSNHDAWFVHGNDKKNIQKLYKEAAEHVVDYGDYWLQSMVMTYGVKGFGENITFDKLFLIQDPLTKEDVRNAQNLVG